DRATYLPGLGLHGLGVWQITADPPEVERANEWADKIDVTTKALLGLTVGCARCHDHKYDPIPTKDYYRPPNVFFNSQFPTSPLAPKEVVDDYEGKKKTLDAKQAALTKFINSAKELHSKAAFVRMEDYMLAAWRLGVEPTLTVESVAKEHQLDP